MSEMSTPYKSSWHNNCGGVVSCLQLVAPTGNVPIYPVIPKVDPEVLRQGCEALKALLDQRKADGLPLYTRNCGVFRRRNGDTVRVLDPVTIDQETRQEENEISNG